MSLIVVCAAAFSIGLYGVLTRRDVIGVLASIEIMLGGASVLLVGLATAGGGASSPEAAGSIGGVALIVLVVAAAEAAVGLALLVAVARSMRTTRIDEMTEVGG